VASESAVAANTAGRPGRAAWPVAGLVAGRLSLSGVNSLDRLRVKTSPDCTGDISLGKRAPHADTILCRAGNQCLVGETAHPMG